MYIRQEVTNLFPSRTCLENQTIAGDSPVDERMQTSVIPFPSTTGHGKPCGNLARPWAKAKYTLVTDSELVP